MVREIFEGTRVQLTVHRNSPTLDRGGTFVMPQVDSANNEIHGANPKVAVAEKPRPTEPRVGEYAWPINQPDDTVFRLQARADLVGNGDFSSDMASFVETMEAKPLNKWEIEEFKQEFDAWDKRKYKKDGADDLPAVKARREAQNLLVEAVLQRGMDISQLIPNPPSDRIVSPEKQEKARKAWETRDGVKGEADITTYDRILRERSIKVGRGPVAGGAPFAAADLLAIFGAAPIDPTESALHGHIIGAINGKDLDAAADRSGFFLASGPGTLDAVFSHIQTQKEAYITAINSGILTPTQIEEYQHRVLTANRYMDRLLDGVQRVAVIKELGGTPNYIEVSRGQLDTIQNLTAVANTLQQSGEDLDVSEEGPLRPLLSMIDNININLQDEYFKQVVDSFGRRAVGTGPGQISSEAKFFLLEYLAERFLSKEDALPDVAWEMPIGLYVGGNFEYLEQVSEHEFGKGSREHVYIIRLKEQRRKMHELYRSIPLQEQYKQLILDIGDVGLDFVHNEIAGVADAFALYEEIGLSISTMTSHTKHRILNDEEFKKINSEVYRHVMRLQKEGVLRSRTGRRLTKREAERAFVEARAVAGGLQRTGIAMGLGGAPAHATQVYRPAAHAGIQKSMYSAKFSEYGLMGYAPGRYLMSSAYDLANEAMEEGYEENLKKGKALRSRHVDGVVGVSKYISWINTLSAPDILTNPSRSGAMALADIWFQRTVGGVTEQTTLLNVLHQIGARRKAEYMHKHGKPYPDAPDGFMFTDDLASEIKGSGDNFENVVLKQRLYLSYLAQYDAMPTDIREKLFKKIAVLKPQDMVSFYPELLTLAKTQSGQNDAVWQSLHEKLILQGRKRIIDEGRRMMNYNQSLRDIKEGRDAGHFQRELLDLRGRYRRGEIDNRQYAAGRADYLKTLRRLHDVPRYEADQATDFAATDAGFIGAHHGQRYQLLNDPDYLGGRLTPGERALAEKIIDLSVGVQRVDHITGNPVVDAHGNPVFESEPIAKTVSEAKIAYKLALDDMPHVAWAATGEGGGGLGRGSILSMYTDQQAVNQGVGEHLSHLMLDPINDADKHIAEAVHQFGIHYGIGDAQGMFKPIILAFALMVKENFWARHTGKELRDRLLKPNSAMEEYFQVKGYALDEVGLFKLFAKLANTHAIANEKETMGRRLVEQYMEHQHENYHTGTKLQRHIHTIHDIFSDRHFLKDLWKKGVMDSDGKGKSSLDNMLIKVGADAAGRNRARKRRFLQIIGALFGMGIAKLFVPDDARKAAGI